MDELSITTFGVLRVTLGGEPVLGFRSDKERALLVYLAVEADRPHRREKLTGLLWPEFPESNARHTLSQSLTDLRHALADRERASPYLDATRATVALNAAGHTWVDVREFDALVDGAGPSQGRDGEQLRTRAEIQDGARGLEQLAQAVTLYQGAFLDGFSLADAPAFEEWLLLQRERRHRQVTEALALLVDEHTAQGAYEEALRFAWRQVELDPWREGAQRQLIRLLGLTGQRAAALRQYEICSHVLEEELGVAPDSRTQALHQAISTGTLVGENPTIQIGLSPAGTSGQGAQELPVPLMPLIGREAELEELEHVLEEPEVRLLTLLGPGGIGKTRLALELAKIHAPSFSDGARVVPLVATTSWEACVAAIAQAVGLVASEQSGSVEQQLLRYLRGKSILLLLDNVEQLVAHAPRIVHLIESTPNLRVIATSRARLGVLGEVVFPVDALAVPEDASLDVDRLSEVAAVQLFVRSAQRVAHDFRLSADSAPAVVAICRRVEGMPLALLLAASWADVLSPSQILDRLTDSTPVDTDQPIDFLRATWSDMPARQRSMRAVFDHSWRLMRVREQAVLQALSVFRGGFTTEAAFFVVGASLREFRRLVAQSLLSRVAGGRYGIHELLRQYAAERLSQVAVAERVARDRHASYYVGGLRRWFEDAKGPRQVAALAEMDAEIDNAQAAWDWIVDLDDVTQIGQAVDGLCLYYSRRARFKEAAQACRAALECLEGLPTEDHLKVEARLLIWLSELTPDDQALDAVKRALNVLASPELSPSDVNLERGRALCRRADLLINTDRAGARSGYEQSLSLFREIGDRWEESRVLDRLAHLTMLLTDFAAAQEHCETLLAIGRTLGDLHATAYALRGLSNNAFYQAQPKEALEFAKESLAVRRELGDPLETVAGIQTLALRYLGNDQPERALLLYDESIGIMDRLGLPAPYDKGLKAWALMLYGRYEGARILAYQAVSEAHLAGARRLVAWSEYVLGSLALVSGEVEAAIAQLSHCVDEFRAFGEMGFLSLVLSFLGYAYRAHGKPSQAKSRFVEALRIAMEAGSIGILSWTLPGVATLYADAGKPARALALASVVAKFYPMPGASVWFADVAGPEYHAAMEALTPEEVAEAEASVLTSDMYTEAKAVLAELDT